MGARTWRREGEPLWEKVPGRDSGDAEDRDKKGSQVRAKVEKVVKAERKVASEAGIKMRSFWERGEKELEGSRLSSLNSWGREEAMVASGTMIGDWICDDRLLT